MKMKRFISAVAALTMSVSCFAGLTITANAADYQIDEVLYGVKTMDTEDETKIKSVAAQESFAGDTTFGSEDTTTYATGKTVGGVTFLSGSVIKHGRANNTKSFEKAYDSGKVHFEIDWTVIAGKTNMIRLNNDTGAAVVMLYSSDKNSTGDIKLFTAGTDEITKNVYTPRSGFYRLSIDLDLDQDTYSYTVIYPTKGSGGNPSEMTTATGEGNLPANTNVKTLAMNSTGANDSYFYVDNLALYHSSSTAVPYAYTLNYKLNGASDAVKTVSQEAPEGTVITAESTFVEGGNTYFITAATAPTLTVSSTPANNVLDVEVREANTYNISVVASTGQTIATSEVTEGQDYSYAFSKYLTDSNNKVTASTDTTPYSVTLSKVDDTTVNFSDTNSRTYQISIPYTAYEGDAWFYEAEAEGTAYNDSTSSGGQHRKSFNEGATITTAPVSGKYKVTMHTGVFGYKVDVYKGAAAEEENLLLTTSSGNTTISTETDVELKAGDAIYAKGGHGSAGLDYILLERTGDLPVAVATPSVVESAPALTSPTGKLGTEPTFDDIASHLEGYALIKVDVTNPLDGIYPKVTIKGTDYQLTATDITAVEGENNTVSYYIAFKAATQADLADFGDIVFAYGDTSKTFTFVEE